jgi:hypothetical protein
MLLNNSEKAVLNELERVLELLKKNIQVCPKCEGADVVSNTTYYTAPSYNPDSRNPVIVVGSCNSYCAYCGSPGKESPTIVKLRESYKAWLEENVMPLLEADKAAREEIERKKREKYRAELERKEAQLVEEACKMLGVDDLVAWFESLPPDEQRIALYEMDPYDGGFGSVRNFRNPSAVIAEWVINNKKNK